MTPPHPPRRVESTLSDVGRGLLGVAVIIALVAGFRSGWDALPWAWILGVAAVGFAVLASADVVGARVAHRRMQAADAFLARDDSEEE